MAHQTTDALESALVSLTYILNTPWTANLFSLQLSYYLGANHLSDLSSSRGRPLRVRRKCVSQRWIIPEQLQIPVYMPGWRSGLRATLRHGRETAQPRLPHASQGQSARKMLWGMGMRLSPHQQHFHGLFSARWGPRPVLRISNIQCKFMQHLSTESWWSHRFWQSLCSFICSLQRRRDLWPRSFHHAWELPGSDHWMECMLKDVRSWHFHPCDQWQPWVPFGEAVSPLHGPSLRIPSGGENQGRSISSYDMFILNYSILCLNPASVHFSLFAWCV